MTIDRRNFLTRSAAWPPRPPFPRPPGHARIGSQAQAGTKRLLLRQAAARWQHEPGGCAFDFCAQHGVDALDATDYYFPGYPKVPPDEYVYNLKRTAFVNGVAISGTGVRNDFAVADTAARNNDVQMVKDWIVVASKLGAPVIRVFSGPSRPAGHSFDEALEWMVADFKECAAFGQQHGVVVAIQQHNDFLKTADGDHPRDRRRGVRLVRLHSGYWQPALGRSVRRDREAGALRGVVADQGERRPGRQEEPTDLAKIKAIIDRSGYRGYVPFEALGTGGDPRVKVTGFLEKIRQSFSL